MNTTKPRTPTADPSEVHHIANLVYGLLDEGYLVRTAAGLKVKPGHLKLAVEHLNGQGECTPRYDAKRLREAVAVFNRMLNAVGKQ